MTSKLENDLHLQLAFGQLDRGMKIEHRFDEVRKWRFDFAWPDRMVSAEVEGGTWAGGRHSRGQGFEDDCEKYNRAAQLGWRVFRFTGAMVRDGRAFAMLSDVIIPF